VCEPAGVCRSSRRRRLAPGRRGRDGGPAREEAALSGLCLIARNEGPVDPASFDRLFRALDHLGADGGGVLSEEWLALGHRALWTTPEEVDARQPLACAHSGLALAWCGRLDNRDELLGDLEGLDGSQPDAAVALAAWRRWGERSLSRLHGPFSLALVDRRQRRVFLARDPLGQRGLAFRGDGHGLIAATEEAALLAEGSATGAPDDRALSRLFALARPEPDWTFFRDVRRVPPGALVRWGEGRLTVERYWEPPEVAVRRRSDAEHAEEVRSALDRAVAVRMRSRLAPAVMMSGGLDSTSVAALMARRAPGTAAISWMFDELRQADEREWILPMSACGLEHVAVAADGAWPLRRLGSRPVNPNAPIENLYCGLVDESYRRVADRGGRVLLNGEHGDQLYADAAFWLSDLLASGRWLRALSRIARLVATPPAADRQRGPGVRAALGCLRASHQAPGPPPWLTDLAREHWPAPVAHRTRSAAAWDRFTLDWDARSAEWEARRAAQLGVEVRRPYRDRRLIEVFLGLPADQLFDPPWTKSVLRRAMAGILPETVRLRTRSTSLLPLAARGLDRREADAVSALLARDGALWPRYLRREWLLPEGRRAPAPLVEGRASLLGWLALTTEIWAAARATGAAGERPGPSPFAGPE
jgi:asparagine synthase (glutamine-hydrolysing)